MVDFEEPFRTFFHIITDRIKQKIPIKRKQRWGSAVANPWSSKKEDLFTFRHTFCNDALLLNEKRAQSRSDNRKVKQLLKVFFNQRQTQVVLFHHFYWIKIRWDSKRITHNLWSLFRQRWWCLFKLNSFFRWSCFKPAAAAAAAADAIRIRRFQSNTKIHV